MHSDFRAHLLGGIFIRILNVENFGPYSNDTLWELWTPSLNGENSYNQPIKYNFCPEKF